MNRITIILFSLLISTVLKGREITYFTNSNVFLDFGGAAIFSADYERINEMVIPSKL